MYPPNQTPTPLVRLPVLCGAVMDTLLNNAWFVKINIIESVDSISRDDPDMPYM